jgi:hypothetical protein
MPILRVTDLMRDSSTAWPSGQESDPKKLHSATSLRMRPRRGGKNAGFVWGKCESATVGPPDTKEKPHP